MRRIVWLICSFFPIVIVAAQTYPDMGGARIKQPFTRSVSGAVCFTGTNKLEGNAFFNFPTQDKKVLSFTIGPAGPGQQKNDPFNGPGIYSNISILIQPEQGDSLSGYGEVVVNEDSRTGTFSFKAKSDDDDDDDEEGTAASGTWDCGRALKH